MIFILYQDPVFSSLWYIENSTDSFLMKLDLRLVGYESQSSLWKINYIGDIDDEDLSEAEDSEEMEIEDMDNEDMEIEP